MTADPVRCPWARIPEAVAYHDAEWGVPVHDDRLLFEMLVLEGAQAGLSWDTILKKRARYREVFAGFDPARVARFTPAKIERLLADPGVVRHRGKLEGAVESARAFLQVQRECGSFDAWLWAFVDGEPIVTRRRRMADIPTSTPLAATISKELKRRGFTFVGPTIVYAWLQGVGVVDDHLANCFRAKRG